MESRLDTILLVEDDEIDTELALRIIKLKAPAMNIVTAASGMAALEFLFPLRQSDAPANLPNVKIIILDLHMPGIDGLEVLKRIKTDAAAKLIPVVVFTSSREMKDVEFCYRHGANSYIVKPIDMEHYEDVVSSIVQYWSHHNETMKEYNGVSLAHN